MRVGASRRSSPRLRWRGGGKIPSEGGGSPVSGGDSPSGGVSSSDPLTGCSNFEFPVLIGRISDDADIQAVDTYKIQMGSTISVDRSFSLEMDKVVGDESGDSCVYKSNQRNLKMPGGAGRSISPFLDQGDGVDPDIMIPSAGGSFFTAEKITADLKESLPSSFHEGKSLFKISSAGEGTCMSLQRGMDVDHVGVGIEASNLLENQDCSNQPLAGNLKINFSNNPLFIREEGAAIAVRHKKEDDQGCNSDQNQQNKMWPKPKVNYKAAVIGDSNGCARSEGPSSWTRQDHVRLVLHEERSTFCRDGKVFMDLDRARGNMEKLDKALVGCLLGRRLPFWLIKQEVCKKWDQLGLRHVSSLGEDRFVCWFDSVEATNRVVLGGPWHVAGHVIGVDKWSGELQRGSSVISSPVWLRFPRLPLRYWDDINLSRIASVIGEPLLMDVVTCKWERCSFARICVRIDLSKKLPKGIWIQGLNGPFFQQIEYEGIPSLCKTCGMVGHVAGNCQSIKQSNNAEDLQVKETMTGQGLAMNEDVAAVQGGGNKTINGSEGGEWIIVPRRRRVSLKADKVNVASKPVAPLVGAISSESPKIVPLNRDAPILRPKVFWKEVVRTSPVMNSRCMAGNDGSDDAININSSEGAVVETDGVLLDKVVPLMESPIQPVLMAEDQVRQDVKMEVWRSVDQVSPDLRISDTNMIEKTEVDSNLAFNSSGTPGTLKEHRLKVNRRQVDEKVDEDSCIHLTQWKAESNDQAVVLLEPSKTKLKPDLDTFVVQRHAGISFKARMESHCVKGQPFKTAKLLALTPGNKDLERKKWDKRSSNIHACAKVLADLGPVREVPKKVKKVKVLSTGTVLDYSSAHVETPLTNGGDASPLAA